MSWSEYLKEIWFELSQIVYERELLTYSQNSIYRRY